MNVNDDRFLQRDATRCYQHAQVAFDLGGQIKIVQFEVAARQVSSDDDFGVGARSARDPCVGGQNTLQRRVKLSRTKDRSKGDSVDAHPHIDFRRRCLFRRKAHFTVHPQRPAPHLRGGALFDEHPGLVDDDFDDAAVQGVAVQVGLAEGTHSRDRGVSEGSCDVNVSAEDRCDEGEGRKAIGPGAGVSVDVAVQREQPRPRGCDAPVGLEVHSGTLA